MYSIATYRISTGKEAEALYSKDFFTNNSEVTLFEHRHEIERGKEHLYCGFCGEEIKISGGGETKQRLHFRHKHQNLKQYCQYQEEDNLSKRDIERRRYGNKEEGELHRRMKFMIANTFKKNGASVSIEQWIKNEQEPRHPRRPDIRAEFMDKDVVVEVQITSTFVSVVLEREKFYSSHNMFLLWVFNEFRPDIFTQKDIIYSNRNNAYIFDEEARFHTEKEGRLYLQCYYKGVYCTKQGCIEEQKGYSHQLITFDDLTFDYNDYSVYFFDVKANKEQCEKEKQLILQEQEAIQIRLQKEQVEEMERQLAEQRRLRLEEEQRHKEEQERLRIEEEKRLEEQRIRKLHMDIQNKLTAYLHSELGLDELLASYYSAENKVQEAFNKDVHDEIDLHTASEQCHRYYKEEDIQLCKFIEQCARLNIIIEWEKLFYIPIVIFKDWYSRYMFQHITALLYVKYQYLLPPQYTDKLNYHLNKTIQASEEGCQFNYNEDYLQLTCFERISSSNHKEYYSILCDEGTYKYICSMFSIYLGQPVGVEYQEYRNAYNSYTSEIYYNYYNKLINPYYHLFKRLLECRANLFRKSNFITSILKNQKLIDKAIIDKRISQNHALDALMPILFPDIQWNLQQALF